METSYRRRTRPQTGQSRGKKSKPSQDWRAVILMQCIVSGVVLCALLLISLLNTEFTNDLRDNLKMAISGPTTLDEMKENATEATSVFLNMQDDIKTFFGNSPEAPPPSPTAPADNGSLGSSIENSGSSSETTDFRIDEDILEEITNRKDVYTNDFF